MWAGGKSKVLKDIEPHLPKQFSTYVEPFFGGGAMFIWAYKKNPEATFIINDVNHYIMEIYSNIKNDIAHMDRDWETQMNMTPPPKNGST